METIASIERWVEVNSLHMEKLSEFGRNHMKKCLERLLDHYSSLGNDYQTKNLRQKHTEIEAVILTPILMQSSTDNDDDQFPAQKRARAEKKPAKEKPVAKAKSDEEPKPVIEIPEEVKLIAKTAIDAILAIKDDFPEGSVRPLGDTAVTFWAAVADEVKLKSGLTPEIEEQLRTVGLLQRRVKKIPAGKVAKYFILRSQAAG